MWISEKATERTKFLATVIGLILSVAGFTFTYVYRMDDLQLLALRTEVNETNKINLTANFSNNGDRPYSSRCIHRRRDLEAGEE